MLISGLQKLTLLDYPDKVACTVFTGGCNFRCPFCHNASLVIREYPEMAQDVVLDFLKKRAGLLDGVCITGGEPLIYDDVGDFAAKVKDMGYLVKLDTNGSFPERLESIIKRGVLDHVAMDIKNSPEKYGVTIGVPGYDIANVRKSVDIIRSSGLDYTFRTTLVKPLHTQEDVHAIGRWIEGAKKYNLQTFVDSGDLIGEGFEAFTLEESQQMLDIARQYVPNCELKGI